MTRIYLAGPILHVDDDGKPWRDRVEREYPDIDWVNPLDEFDAAGEVTASPEEIVETDLALINTVDALLVRWKLVPAAGTPMEMYHAKRVLNIPVVVWFDGEDEDCSPWVRYHANTVVSTLDDAYEELPT